MSVSAEDVHVALRVDDRDVAVTGRWLNAADQSKFVLVVGGCGLVVGDAELLSLLHLLVV